MRKGIEVQQHDGSDCGAACLSSVAAYYGLKYPIARIRQYAFTDTRGTNVLGMIEAANKIGFEAKGVKGSFENLYSIPLPIIAHVIIQNLPHFVVLYKINKKHLMAMDPRDGKIHKMLIEEFKSQWTGVLILMYPTDSFQKKNLKENPYKLFFNLIFPHRKWVFQMLLGAILYSILGLSTAVFFGKIADHVLINKNVNLLNLMGVIMIVIILLRTYIGVMKNMLALKTGQHIDASLILGYYKHLLTLPQQFFDTMRVGEIMSRINDAVKIRLFLNTVSLDLIVNLLILFFSLCLMILYSWQLTLIALISLPLFLLTYFLFNSLNKKYQRKIMESGAFLEAHLIESLNSVSTIKQFGIEGFANLKTEIRFVELLKNAYKSTCGSIFTNGSVEFISTGITVAILWVGSLLVINQELTPGVLILFYSLLAYIISPVNQLISSNQNIQDALIAVDRLFQIMDIEREEKETRKITLSRDMIGTIHFENVCFRYGSRKFIFESLNLKIPQGKTTAIIGESGSGKTTLISLLQHLYPLQSGNIRIGNFSLEQISNESLRKLIGSVPQQIELFAGSIVENIALGSFDPDMNRIISLCKSLGITDFIEKLPDSYYTYIGEHGTSLSGGEKQRIAIARALYSDPEIIVLDEATSSLDLISEGQIKQVIKDLAMQNKTIILIAHRLSTIKQADNIIILRDGKMFGEGTHAELLESNSYYRKLWKEQADQL